VSAGRASSFPKESWRIVRRSTNSAGTPSAKGYLVADPSDPVSNQRRYPGRTPMTRFSVGDRVVIRYGKHQGQRADIIKTPAADVYKVKAEDGFILYYSGKGLAGEREVASKDVCGNR
jgi:translation initiation factor IF-1